MSYKEKMQTLWNDYVENNDGDTHTIRDCFDWATKEGRWQPKPLDITKIFGREMSAALRQEIRVDASGRHYRAKHCVRENVGGIQMSFWGDIDKSSKIFMEKSFQQRRKSMVNDGHHLKQDVDHFNEYRSPHAQIPLVLDFTDDVSELEEAKKIEHAA